MKQMWQPIKVLSIQEKNNKTILQIVTDATKEEILKYSLGKGIEGELRFEDYRLITAEQRKKIFATIKDFSIYTGYDAEYARQLLTLSFCYEVGIEPFSLSNCSLEVAKEFINYLIEFCIDNEIPLSEMAIERTNDINKYLYMCIKKSICCCCGKKGIVYRFNDGKRISLCNIHYDEAKLKGLRDFEKLYKVYGIKIKE